MSQVKKINILNSRLFYFILAALPFFQLAHTVRSYSVDVPVWDQWELVPLFEKLFNGTLSFRDVWAQHNEHRIFFPKLIMLFLARFTGWNLSFELAVNVLLGAGIFACVAAQILLTVKSTGERRLLWAVPVCAVMIFSLKQWMNWVWGWQMQIFLCVFCATAGIVLLSNPPFRLWRFLSAMLMGVAASFSFAGGLCYWFAGFFILFFVRHENKKIWKVMLFSWFVLTCAVYSFYFYDFHKPENQPLLRFMFEHPAEYVNYFFSYLGLPLTRGTREESFALGVLGVFFSCFVTWFVVRFRGVKFQTLVPYVALCVFSVISGAVTGIGRAAMNKEYALGFHYTTIAMMFWICFLVLIHFLMNPDTAPPGGSRREIPRAGVIFLFSFYAVVLFLMVYSSAEGGAYCMDRYYFFMPARYELFELRDDKMLRRLYPSADVVKQRTRVLMKYHLSVFRELQKK